MAIVRYDGTMYKSFYDRHLIVTVSSEPGSPSSTIPEDKRIIPDNNVLSYEVIPGMSDRIIRISVSIRVLDCFASSASALFVGCQESHLSVRISALHPRRFPQGDLPRTMPWWTWKYRADKQSKMRVLTWKRLCSHVKFKLASTLNSVHEHYT